MIRISTTSTLVARESERVLTALDSGELCEMIRVVNTWFPGQGFGNVFEDRESRENLATVFL